MIPSFYSQTSMFYMNQSLFADLVELDRTYLEEAYGDDAETASMVFEQYLQDLPGNLGLIMDSVGKRNIEQFRHHIHKQKPGYSYVGLTDVTKTFHDLQLKCQVVEDLQTHKIEIEKVLTRINGSRNVIEKALLYLRDKAA